MHPLDGARLRFERADRHLAEADDLIRQWSVSCKDGVVSDHEGKISFPNGWPSIPRTLPVVISDAIHNLRAALDYVVYELAILDTGQEQDRTQFIIEDVKADPRDPQRGFDPRSKRHLRGLSAAHVGH